MHSSIGAQHIPQVVEISLNFKKLLLNLPLFKHSTLCRNYWETTAFKFFYSFFSKILVHFFAST